MKLPRMLAAEGPDSPHKPAVVAPRHDEYSVGHTTGGLSVVFTVLCIVDLFGVFPVVALPKSVISCGIYGIPLVLAVFCLQLYTAVLLGRSWLLAQEITPNIREKNRFPYAAVAELAFGRVARRMVTFLLDATIFGAGVPNFIFASQSLQLFWWKITGGEVGVSYCYWMILIGLLLCPVMWLGSPKDMKPVAVTSVCIVATVAICTWTCILQDDVSPPSAGGVLDHRPSSQDLLIAYGILAFQFDIHPMLLTIQVDMKDGRRIHSAALAGFVATGSMFAVTAFLAASRYGLKVDYNILQDFCVQRCIIRSSIVALAVFLGESVPRFDLVMGLVGSTLTGPLMFVFPPLFFLKLCYIKSNLSKNEFLLSEKNQNGLLSIQNGGQDHNGDLSKLPLNFKTAIKTYRTFVSHGGVGEDTIDEYRIKWCDVVLASLVMVLGVAATAVATYASWSDTISSAIFSPPCLVNATSAARSFLQISALPL